jgi:hypothetical protein
MYYDDEARRFNFLSGLLLGAVLGTGIALAAKPPRKRTGSTLLGGSAAGVVKTVKGSSSKQFADLIKKTRRR